MAMQIRWTNEFSETIISEIITNWYPCYAFEVSEHEKYTIIIASELCFDILLH